MSFSKHSKNKKFNLTKTNIREKYISQSSYKHRFKNPKKITKQDLVMYYLVFSPRNATLINYCKTISINHHIKRLKEEKNTISV